MKQNILTSKISFKLHYKNKAMGKSPLNKQLTCSIPQILTLAIQLLYLKIILEYIYWHQTREMQHFLHIKVSRQILLHTGKACFNLKDESKTCTGSVPLPHVQDAMKYLELLLTGCHLSSTQTASSYVLP